MANDDFSQETKALVLTPSNAIHQSTWQRLSPAISKMTQTIDSNSTQRNSWGTRSPLASAEKTNEMFEDHFRRTMQWKTNRMLEVLGSAK